MMRVLVCLIPTCLFTACSTPEPTTQLTTKAAEEMAPSHHFTPTDLPGFQKVAAHFKSVVAVPELETNPTEIQQSVSNTIARGSAALDAIGACGHDKLTFGNTFGALDDLSYDVELAANRLNLIKDTSTNAALREAATEASKTISEWAVGLEYREDVYRVVNAYALTLPKLKGEEDKLLREILRDYRRAGLELPKSERDEVERLRKSLTKLTTDFES